MHFTCPIYGYKVILPELDISMCGTDCYEMHAYMSGLEMLEYSKSEAFLRSLELIYLVSNISIVGRYNSIL